VPSAGPFHKSTSTRECWWIPSNGKYRRIPVASRAGWGLGKGTCNVSSRNSGNAASGDQQSRGLSDDAGSEILVSKKGETTRRVSVTTLFGSGDETANIVLTGGEEVRVPEAGRVYVVGNVKRPCNFLLKQGEVASVLKAMSYAEGLMSYTSAKAYIYRREANGNKNEIEIPLRNIMTRKASDVPLMADDILYIPENDNRKLLVTTLGKVLLIGGGAIATALVVYH